MATDNSILEYIRNIQEEKKTGCLNVAHREQAIRIYVLDGSISAISSNIEGDRLGQHLVRAGFIDSTELQKLLKRSAQTKAALGETAVQQKILNPAELTQLLHRQALQVFQRCLENGFQIDSFEAGSYPSSFPGQVDLAWLLLERARHTCGPNGDFDEAIVLRKKEDLSRVPWSPEEIAVLGQLTIPRTLSELVLKSGIGELSVRKIVNVLRQLDLIETVNEASGDGDALEPGQSFPWERLTPLVKNPLQSDKLEILKNESSFISEQFKSLKVRINELRISRKIQVINITSSDVEDGKSLVSANAAFCFSNDPGRRTVLVDCDLRVPTAQKYLGIPLEPGVLTYLKDTRLSPYCCVRRVGNLYVMTAGGVADNPVELLTLNRMRRLINYLKGEFETIILDSPPVQPIPDGRILSSLADGTVMVIRRGKTAYSSVERALKCLDPKKLLGVVFNDVKPLMFHTYYNYKYYHYGRQAYVDYARRDARRAEKSARTNKSQPE